MRAMRKTGTVVARTAMAVRVRTTAARVELGEGAYHRTWLFVWLEWGPPFSGRSAICRWRIAADRRPRTFSIRNMRGLIASTKRRNCQSRVPRGSCTVSLLPTVLKVWHGGPPTSRSISPGLIPSLSSISWGAIVEMSPSSIAMSGGSRPASRFNLAVSQNECSFSTHAQILNRPACSRPRSNPIPPEKSETTLY